MSGLSIKEGSTITVNGYELKVVRVVDLYRQRLLTTKVLYPPKRCKDTKVISEMILSVDKSTGEIEVVRTA